MKILVRIPNWLGDAVMFTPTLSLLKKQYPDSIIYLVGPKYLKELFYDYEYIIDDTKSSKNRFLSTYKLAKTLNDFDLAITAQNTLLSALFLFWTNAKQRVGFKKNIRYLFLTKPKEYNSKIHQAARFASLVSNDSLNEHLKLSFTKKIFQNFTVAIAPSAAYGDAKKWMYFAECIEILSTKISFDLLLLGAKSDFEICEELKNKLAKININSSNFAGQTSLNELVSIISGVNLFLTNDSGPMHIAAATNTPTVAIFGSTDPNLTGPWMANRCKVAINKIDCSPCFKRTCKYGHYDCLAKITPQYVANLSLEVINSA